MKPDNAIQALTTALFIGAVVSFAGIFSGSGVATVAGLAVIVAGVGIANAMWQPVRDGEERAAAYLAAYNTEKRWLAIRRGQVTPSKAEADIIDWTTHEFVEEVVLVWQDAGYYKTAKERSYHYYQGQGWIVETAEGEQAPADGSKEMDKVKYNEVEWK